MIDRTPGRTMPLAVAITLWLCGVGLAQTTAIPLGRPFGRGVEIQSAAEVPSSPGRRVSVLVRLRPGADRGRVRDFARGQGARVHHEYTLVPGLINLRNLPEKAITQLERTEGVEFVKLDGVVRPHLNQGTPLIRALRTQLESAGYPGASGAGVRICIVDTGVDSDHLMFASRIDFTAGKDFVNGDGDPEDDHGHGTHVAGIAAGGDNTIDSCTFGEPFQGVGWEATLVGVKVINACGIGSDSDLIAGIEHCADQSTTGGRADVINLSVGTDAVFSGPCDLDPVAEAANLAVAAGVVVVSSAGNSANPNGLSSPACGSNVLAVGATWDDDFPESCEFPFPCWDFGVCGECDPRRDQVACFSNRSNELDVVAPGCLTLSADYSNPGGATWMCGTSMAAPHVSGLAALLLSYNPTLSPAQVARAIRGGAIDLGSAGPDSSYGHGRVDAINSLGLADCSSAADCDDGDPCTVDVCDVATVSCTNTPVTCGLSDSCCIQGCGDPDCTCSPVGSPCDSDGQCCSGKCRGKSGNQICR